MSDYYSSKYDPNSSSRDNSSTNPYSYTSSKSYGGYNPTLRSTATHTDDWIKEVYRNQFNLNKDNFKNYDRDSDIITNWLNENNNNRESAFDKIMDYGLGESNDTDRVGYGELTYNKAREDLFNNDYNVNGYNPTMKSTAINDRDWVGDVYRNQYGLNNNTDKTLQSEQDQIVEVMNNLGLTRQQAFNWMMQNSGDKTLGNIYNRDLTDAEKEKLLSENNLTAFGGFDFSGNQYLSDNTFRNNMYNKGGQYLNEQQRLINETEQTRMDDLSRSTSDARFNELSSQYNTGLSDLQNSYSNNLSGIQSNYSTELAAQKKAFDDYKAGIATQEQAEAAKQAALAAEKTAREKELTEQNQRNIAGRLDQRSNKTNDYMLYLEKNNKPLYERIMQSLQVSNPEMYQTIMDVSGAAA